MKTLFFVILFFVPTCLFGQWIEVGAGVSALNANNSIWNVCSDTGQIIYAAGGFSTGSTPMDGNVSVARWDGSIWAMLPFGTDSSPAIGGIEDICVDSSHRLYAAVGLSSPTFKYFVAQWSGSTWLELGSGATALNANDFINSICTDPAGNIYAAGVFSDGSTSTSGHKYVAKWNGSNWSMLGTGSSALNPNSDILSIASDQHGNIYAAGHFWNSTGYNYVAKWNGTAWSQLGSLNADGTIWTIHCDKDGNLYAGGFFQNSLGRSYVAKWDGSSWSELGVVNTLNAIGDILDITSDNNGNIYVAGWYESGKSCVAKWNGSTWSTVGIGANSLNGNGDVYGICTDRMNNVYAVGGFTNGVTSSYGHPYVAEYSPSTNQISVAANCDFKVFPIPATSVLHIESLDKVKDAKFYLYDLSGRLIKMGMMTNGEINLVDVETGCYVLRVFNLEGKVLSATFNKY